MAVCGRRWGKSLSAAREVETVLLQPNKRCWIVAPTYDLTDKVFREIWQELIIKQGFPVKRKSERERIIEFNWGSIIEGKSADSPDSLVGEGLDFLVLDEAAKIKKRIWEQYLRPTLSDREGEALFISTPEGFNWFYDIFERGQGENVDWWSIQSSTYDNPYVSRKDLDEAKGTLTKEYYEQEYLAMFTSFAGKVYPIDRTVHVGKYPFQPEWETYCSVDFGYRMPSVGWYQVGRVAGRWEVHLIDEISHVENIKTEDLCDRILGKGYPLIAIFGDPAGGGVQSQSGIGDIEIFKRKGMYVKYLTDKISRSIPSGVEHLRSWFENAKGEARFFIDSGCVGHIRDFENYRYPEKKDDRTLKDEPMKDGIHDHGCDDARYFFINRFPIKDRAGFTVQW